MTDGKKDKLIQRLIQNEKKMTNPEDMKMKLKSFLELTGAKKESDKPTITSYYADTYKLVDRFNALLGVLQWPYRINQVTLVWWINIIKMITVNAWIVWNDFNAMDNIDNEEESLKQFVKTLYNAVTE